MVHFLEKNKDTLRSDVVELMCESKNKVSAPVPHSVQKKCLNLICFGGLLNKIDYK